MKFIVSSSQLLKHLQQISGVLSTNTVLPILLDFLFEIEENQLTIVGTDLETVIRVKMDIDSQESGRLCIPARILVDSLKNIPDQPLTFNIDKSFGVEITSDTGKYKVMGEDPDNFPKDPVTEDTKGFAMPASAFQTVIDKCLFATSVDSLRPAMSGVYFGIDDSGLTTVATDAHRLVRLIRKDVTTEVPSSFIVPKKPLTLIKSLIPTTEEEVQVKFNEKHLFLSHEHSEVICRLIDARFPDYKVVIPQDNPYKLVVNKNNFQNALKRVSVFSNKSTYQVALSISGSELQLESQDIDLSFEGSERMGCQYDGEDIQIAFNAKFLIEMLSAAESEEVVMELSTPTKPGILKPVGEKENEDLLMLVMPLMLNV